MYNELTDEAIEEFDSKRLTIQEMREIFIEKQESYDWLEGYSTDLQKDEQNALYYTDYVFAYSANTLYDHLMAEQLWEVREQVDWKRVTRFYDSEQIARIYHLLSSPLLWADPLPFERNCVIVGRVAQEVNPEWTDQALMDWHQQMFEENLLWFADTLPVADDVHMYRYHRLPKDMLLWDRILTGWNNNMSVSAFRNNINFIAEQRGGVKAVELIKRLRDDWKDIQILRLFGFEGMKPQEVEEFRLALFEGMDRNVRIWDAEAIQETAKAQPIPCRYIDKDKLAQTGIHTEEQFTTMLRQACEQDAKTLGAFLKKYYKMGYLDFHGDSKKKIYDHLKACFQGAIKYSYPNFTQYFD